MIVLLTIRAVGRSICCRSPLRVCCLLAYCLLDGPVHVQLMCTECQNSLISLGQTKLYIFYIFLPPPQNPNSKSEASVLWFLFMPRPFLYELSWNSFWPWFFFHTGVVFCLAFKPTAVFRITLDSSQKQFLLKIWSSFSCVDFIFNFFFKSNAEKDLKPLIVVWASYYEFQGSSCMVP